MLAAALAGLKVSRETSRQFTVLAVDQSRSIAPEAGKIVERWRSQWHAAASTGQASGTHTGAGQGRGTALSRCPLPPSRAPWQRSLPAPRTDGPPGTNIAAAIAAARATMPDEYVPQIVLFSDGNADHRRRPGGGQGRGRANRHRPFAGPRT